MDMAELHFKLHASTEYIQTEQKIELTESEIESVRFRLTTLEVWHFICNYLVLVFLIVIWQQESRANALSKYVRRLLFHAYFYIKSNYPSYLLVLIQNHSMSEISALEQNVVYSILNRVPLFLDIKYPHKISQYYL